MKKIFLFLIILLSSGLLSSCGSKSNIDKIKVDNVGVQVGEIKVSTGKINIESKVIVESTGVLSDSNEEKDVVIIKNDNDDFDGKTQEEVINEMGDYVNDLFNMIEEDVK